MKLRIDLSIFLIISLLSTALRYNSQDFSKDHKLDSPITNEKTTESRSSGGRSSSKQEYTMEVYDYSDTIWTFEEGMDNSLSFAPGNVSKYATIITGFDVSDRNVATADWDEDHGFRIARFSPKGPGITNITIYVANDAGEKGKTTFRFETKPYQRPIPTKIEHQYIEKGYTKSFYIRELLENGNDIWAQINDASSSDTEIAGVYVDNYKRLLTINGLSKGESTVTAYVRNMSQLGINDIVSVQISVTVTESVYGN